MSKLQQPIKWHGGKHYLADWIISHMPAHTHYVEPFFGGGSVLLQKDPEGVSEVVNDLNSCLAVFWAVLRSDEWFEEFKRCVESTPFCESVFEQAKQDIVHDNFVYVASAQAVSAAWRFFIRARQSRQGLMKDFATLSRNRTRRGMNEQVSSWLTAIDGLPDVHARLKRVVLLNRPAIEVIDQQDGPNTLFYLDPPYLHETRVTTSDYAHEMTAQDHADLLVVLGGTSVCEHLPLPLRKKWHLTAKGIRGKFLLSGYPSDLYRDVAEGVGWRCVTREIDNKASSAKTKEKKTECLWMNYDPPVGDTA